MGCAICSPTITELLKGSVQKAMCDHTVQVPLMLLGEEADGRMEGKWQKAYASLMHSEA